MLALLGRAPAAVTELGRASTELTDPALRYYAEMFLGAALEASAQSDGARAAYTSAAALFPTAQSPRMALSHLAFSRGDRGAATEAIAPLLASSDNESEREDPWWTYLTACGRQAQELIAQARDRLSTPRAVAR